MSMFFSPDSMAAYYFDQGFQAYLSGEEEEEPIRCRYCGRAGYEWMKTERGWRLITTTGKVHKCKAYR